MSEEIVACPGCAKKFRIPEGAPPGSFACTACEADVPYGAPAAKPASSKAPARPAPAVAKAAAPARPAPAARAAPAARPAPVAARAAPAAASSRRAAPAPARRAGRGHADEAEPKKDNHGLIWGGIGVGGAVVLFLAYWLTKPADAPAPAPTPPAPAAAPVAPKPKPVETPKTEPPAPATTAPPASEPPKTEPPKGEAPKPDPKAPEAKAPVPEPKKVKGDYSTLGQTFASVEGMSEADRAAADKFVATAMDRNSGKDGSEAEGKLLQLGKKASPSILSAFGKQYSTGKWATDEDQWSADKLQDLLHRIAGADGLNPREEFWPRFMSGAPPADFEKAANLWVSWWTTKGQFATKFKRQSD